ncbi:MULTISPECIES: hypothetical protein [spotted fever group]|uniref:Viral A-type inclusion protein n=1 Tax=Rickettsia tamurae subsp. buchneri TaxID=1462938 RepID=A0A8E1BZ87_9RICK|nr:MULTISPECIES: hypothetical protein [spotted fever group]EER20775.1 putative viral A-type inclusion protein [Rickettsia endosymbiont of Ixodes scapularis]KDO02121.1 hypothetical protein REISMN_08690 [Rickettsia tamurae subsp. buchneri]
MKKESNNQNQDLEDKQNIVAVEENTLNTEKTKSSESETMRNDSALTKLIQQMHFTAKLITEKEKHLNQTLNKLSEAFKQIVEQSTSDLNNINSSFRENIQKQAKQYEILKTEVGVLTLLPEKTKEAITNIIPDVAKELDKIQREYTKSLHDSYSTIISGYAEGIHKYKAEIEQVSHGVTSHITKHMSSVDQKLDEYSKKLSASAAYVVECSNYSFLKNMCLVVLFSAIVAGGTAYLVITRFPRYLTITGANDVTIQDCNVSVLGKAKDPDNLMDKMTKKK